MQTPEQIVAQALSAGGQRSAEYRQGMLDVLCFLLQGRPIGCPYAEGSAQFDAYFAGNAHGHVLARDYRGYWRAQ